VRLSGDEDDDRARMTDAAPGPIDVVVDLLPPTAGTTPVRAAAMTVREHGRVVLMAVADPRPSRPADTGLPEPRIKAAKPDELDSPIDTADDQVWFRADRKRV
jgi:hypothetical protein